MAHLFRLTLAAFLAAFSLSAFALVPAGVGYRTTIGYASVTSVGEGSTAQQSCAVAAAGWNHPTSAMTVKSAVENLCTVIVKRKDTGEVVSDGAGFSTVKLSGVCPANSTSVTGGCQCNSPYVENAAKTACELPPSECEKLAGKSAGNRKWDAGLGFNNRSSAPHYYCDGWNPAAGGKCVAVAGTGDVVWTFEDGHWWGTGTAVYTGATASTCTGIGGDGNTPAASTPKTPDGTPPKNPDPGTSAPSPCPQGQSAGEVNGTRVCAPTGSDTPKAAHESDTKKNPDGSTTQTDTDTRCNGVKCETDTRVCKTGTNGLQTCETTTTSSEQSGFCNKPDNKGNKVCQGQGEGTPSSFGGTCASGFTAVSDDAVINAMAAETFRQNCKVNPDDASQVVGKAEAAKTGNQTGSNPNNGSVSIGPGSFDSSNALGAGASCIADQSVTVLHWTATLPFSKVCSSLDILGLALLAVSSLLAARIVARG